MYPHVQTRCRTSSDPSNAWPRTQSFQAPRRPALHWHSAITEWLSDLRDWRTRRQAVLQLRELDDHMLRDIGIHRCEIEAVMRTGIGSGRTTS
jgi:uncharacterized protein YjiS (DUF1127 family)